MCLLTRPVTGVCEPYKIFDAEIKECVPGDPETCEKGETTTVEETTLKTTPEITSTLAVTTTPVIISTPEITSTPVITTTPDVTYSSTTSKTTTTPQPPVNFDEICRGIFFSARPYPNSLEIYVGCIRGKGVLFNCLENEFFHPVINECLKWPEATTTTESETTTEPETTTTVPLCNSTPDPETTTYTEAESSTSTEATTTTVPTPLEGICEGKRFEYIEHPTNCALYIFCYDEREFVRQCPEFLIFDIKTSS